MIRLPPRSPRTATLFPYTTLFRSSYVQPGDVVMTLRSTEVLYVDFHVPADVAGRLRTGAVFSASIDGVAAPVDGVLSFVDPEIVEATRSIRLRGDIAHAGGTRLEGDTAELQSLMRTSTDVSSSSK